MKACLVSNCQGTESACSTIILKAAYNGVMNGFLLEVINL